MIRTIWGGMWKSVRRKNPGMGLGVIEGCEPRVLLSAASGKVVVTAQPPAHYSGDWNVLANGIVAYMSVNQGTDNITIYFDSTVVHVDYADGFVNGDKASAQYKGDVMGLNAQKVKFKLEQSDSDHFTGTARGKTEAGKFKLHLEGMRI